MNEPITIRQASSNSVFPKDIWGKWAAGRLTSKSYDLDVEIGTDDKGNPEYGIVAAPAHEYISPTGWQGWSHWFDTAEECQAALAKVGIINVIIKPWIPNKSRLITVR